MRNKKDNNDNKDDKTRRGNITDLDLLEKTVLMSNEQLEEKYAQLSDLNKEVNLQNTKLIRRTIDLEETKESLEDQFYEQEILNDEINRRNTELIRKTIDLTEFKSELEDKNIELEGANNEISRMLTLKTEFINQAAHDLRTPLTPVITLLPLLRQHLKDEHAAHNLEIIQKNAFYIKRIVDELITLIKTESNLKEITFEKISITEILDEILLTQENVIKNHNISIKKDYSRKLPDVELDKFKIIEVIQNLISNAVKFTPEKGTISIIVRKIDNYINVRVADTGIGMTQQTIEKLFTEFFRADDSRHGEGVGLGLSICKRIIEKHNGKIWAESNGKGKGSSIIFQIPIKQ